MNIGIDHGYYAIKTRHFSFPAGIAEYSHEPYTLQNTLEFGGKFYVCGTGRQPILRNKMENDNYYLLTLAAIAKEIKQRGGKTECSVRIAAGLPLAGFGREKKPFREYLLRSSQPVCFKFEGIAYKITILESSAVQSIFENYRNGASLQMLAKQMQQSGLKYRENAVWNKAMIARILDCEKYISEEFPAILPSDLFLQVQRLRKDRAQIYGGSLNPALRGIRDLICCQTCGQKLVRINHRDNVYIIWKCPSCNTETRYLPDIELMSSVLSAINRAIEDPQKVMNFKKNANCLSVQAVRLENEIYRELGNPKSNSKRLLEIIKQCAQEKYKACHANGDSEETECLIAELKKLQPMEHFQSQILRKFICKILITPAGAVTIQLKNGAII